MSGFSRIRLWALCRKEARQILRDPSSAIIAFVQPLLLLFIFGYGINLDMDHLRLGLCDERVRLPLVGLTEPTRRLIDAALDHAGLL